MAAYGSDGGGWLLWFRMVVIIVDGGTGDISCGCVMVVMVEVVVGSALWLGG